MIPEKVSSTPKNAYLRCDGKGFNSSLGGLSSEGNALSLIGGNGSNLGTHPFTSNTSLCSIIECRNSYSDVVTSSSQLGLTRQDMSGSVTPRFPVRPDWWIRTEFGVRDSGLGLFT